MGVAKFDYFAWRPSESLHWRYTDEMYVLFTPWIRDHHFFQREILIFNHAHTFLLQEETPNVWPPTIVVNIAHIVFVFQLWEWESLQDIYHSRFTLIITTHAIKLQIIHPGVSQPPLSPYPLFLSAVIAIASKVYSTIFDTLHHYVSYFQPSRL